MSRTRRESEVLAINDLKEWFRGSVREAMRRQEIEAAQPTGDYVTELLLRYARSENFWEVTEEGTGMRPLAIMYRDALEARTEELRRHNLQRLGDIALFVAGYFADSLARKAVDVDYYAGMGEAAYGTLAETPPRSFERLAINEVFRELAEKFTAFMDVLAEVAQTAQVLSEKDILRLYELWIHTGSPRARRQLEALGIQPNESLVSRRTH